MAKDTPREKLVTPDGGIAIYPRLNKPDTKFDKEGVYKVSLRYDPGVPAVAAMVAKVEAFAEANGTKVGPNAIADEADDAGNPTGMIVIKFKVHAEWPDGTSRKPAIVDRNKVPVTDVVGSGSVLRVSGEMSIYEGFGGGVTLMPKAIQVQGMVAWNPGVDDFDDMGDDDEGSDDDSSEPEF